MLPQFNNHFNDDHEKQTNGSVREIGFVQTTGLSVSVKSPAVTVREHVVKLPARAIKWTAIDEQRLNSIERLHRRSRDCSNTIHSINIEEENRLAQASNHDLHAHSRCVMKYVHFKSDVGSQCSFTSVFLPQMAGFFTTHSVTAMEASPVAAAVQRKSILPPNIQQRTAYGVLWVVIMEADFIDVVLRHFNVHDVFISYFHDLRPHSSFLESNSGFFVSVCSCSFQENDRVCKLQKLFVFVSAGLCITFERELLPDVDDPSTRPADNPTAPTTSTVFTTNIEVVSNSLMRRMESMAPIYARKGAPYLMFELLTENIRLQSSLFQFCSVTIFYFKNLIRMNDEDLFDGHIDRQVRVIESCLVLLDKHANSSLVAMQQLSSGHRLLLSKNVNVASNSNWACHFFKLGHDNLPCLDALVDSYSFLTTMLDGELTEIRAVHADMASISTIRQSKTGITLSLVATVFLPMTFLTGVFGMNFQFSGGNGTYTIPIVNNPYGPLYFMYMCLGVSGFAILYFILNGWVKPRSSFVALIDWIQNCVCGCGKKKERDQVVPVSVSDAATDRNSRFIQYSRDSGAFGAGAGAAGSNRNSITPLNSKEMQEAQEEESRRSMRASYVRSRVGTTHRHGVDILEVSNRNQQRPITAINTKL